MLEQSVTFKPQISGPVIRPIRVLLVYPNTTEVALANLGYQRVYTLLNNMDGVVCDRYSLPNDWKPECESLPSSALRSHQLNLPAHEFDMIAFSISFEPDYLHVVALLKYFNIPLESIDRGSESPLILAGGSAVFINPEPLAECVDAFFIGEGENLANQFFNLFTHSEWQDPRELLQASTDIPGIYVPQFYPTICDENGIIGYTAEHDVPERVIRYWTGKATDLCTHTELHGETTAFKDMALMEVTRGCIWACRFCTAGFIYRPPRLPDLELTYNSLQNAMSKQDNPSDTIGLVGPSVTDHPDLLGLAHRIVAEGKKLSFSSLRMETLTDELVDLILKSGQKTLTVAVDGPSERMRDVINKAAEDDFIVEKCRFLTQKGILHLKIYSIIGLPGESDEDIDQFITLVERIHKVYVEACSERGNIGNLTIGLSPLIPKPGTPFQWHRMESVASLKKKFLRLRKRFGRLSNLKMSFGSPNEAFLQTYLSRGDRSLVKFFRNYLDQGHDAKAALKLDHKEVESFVYRQYEKDDFLPWDIIDHGYRNNFLWDDYQRGMKELHTPICDTAVCKICGIC
jgi:radical SAM superfamily enzyme YgiQ (UPF0313 family)